MEIIEEKLKKDSASDSDAIKNGVKNKVKNQSKTTPIKRTISFIIKKSLIIVEWMNKPKEDCIYLRKWIQGSLVSNRLPNMKAIITKLKKADKIIKENSFIYKEMWWSIQSYNQINKSKE